MKTNAVAALVVVTTHLFGCSAPTESVPSSPEVDLIVQPYAAINDFHGLVVVAHDGTLRSVNTYGFADIDKRITHTPSTGFLIGSISKQFTAAIVLKLEEAGLLNTQDHLSRYLPEYPRGNDVTIHQLLIHRSGVPDIYSVPEYSTLRSKPASSLQEIVAALSRTPFTFDPGEAYAYSNGGYALLANVIEVASDRDYGAAVRNYVVDPLGLSDTGHFDPSQMVVAAGYDPKGASDLMAVEPIPAGLVAGSGSIVSSARDLAIWMNAIQEGPYLSSTSRNKMLTDHGDGYGYGLSVYQYADTPVWEHDGRMAGWSSDIAYYAALDSTVIILSNVQSTLRDRIRDNMADLLFRRPLRKYEMRPTTATRVDGRVLGELAGTYSFGPGFEVHAREGDAALMLRANQGEESEFFPVAGDRFFSRTLYASVRFSTPPDTMFYNTGTNEFPGARLR